MSKLIAPRPEDGFAGPEALQQMRERGGKWAAYQNVAMDSSNCGHLQFLAYGEGRTFSKPPDCFPMDNEHGMGWRYRHVGYVDMATGKIIEDESNGA